MYRSPSGRENQDSGSKSFQLGLQGLRVLPAHPETTRLALEIEYPLIKSRVSDLMVLQFASETATDHTIVKIIPVGYILTQIVLLVYLFGSLLHDSFDFDLDRSQTLLAAFQSIEQLDNVLGKGFKLFFGIGLLANT